MENFLIRSGLSRRIQEQKILDSWEKAVGEIVAERTQPMRVKNQVLQVKVSNSVWMQQLQFMKEMIIQRLHEEIKNNFLRDLRFFVGEIDLSERKGKEEKEEELKRQMPGLSEVEKGRIEKEVAAIRDPEIREIIARVFSKGLTVEKNRWKAGKDSGL